MTHEDCWAKVVQLRIELGLLRKAHEGLLATLAPSTHPWVRKVYQNAKAHYDTIHTADPR